MANLPEYSTYDPGVYQLELTDPVIGGANGTSNAPLKNLANRTKYLKDHLDALETLTSTTAPQFDNDDTPASTAFVQRALGNCSATISITGSTVLTQSKVGSYLESTGTGGYNITLPSYSGIVPGATFLGYNNCSSSVSVAAASGQNINIGTSNVAAINIPAGGTYMLISDGASWTLVAGSALEIGSNQSWRNSLTRAVNTTYTNTTGRTIMVVAGVTSTTPGFVGILTIDGVNIYGSWSQVAGTAPSMVTALVPPGSTYALTVSAGTASVYSWAELR